MFPSRPLSRSLSLLPRPLSHGIRAALGAPSSPSRRCFFIAPPSCLVAPLFTRSFPLGDHLLPLRFCWRLLWWLPPPCWKRCPNWPIRWTLSLVSHFSGQPFRSILWHRYTSVEDFPSVSAFVAKMQEMREELAVSGKSISSEDMAIRLLARLPPQFDSLFSSIVYCCQSHAYYLGRASSYGYASRRTGVFSHSYEGC